MYVEQFNEKQLRNVLRSDSLTGREILNKLGFDLVAMDRWEHDGYALKLWSIARLSKNIMMQSISRRYLRIDPTTGDLYVSPSLSREFVDFTAVGLDSLSVKKKVEQIDQRVKEYSKSKKNTAIEIIYRAIVDGRVQEAQNHFCFLMGGDAAHDMAIDTPRIAYDGEVVTGSDIDIMILNNNPNSPLVKNLEKSLNNAILNYRLPPYSEEVDLIMESMDAVGEHSQMETYTDMILSKILAESVFLYGNEEMYGQAIETLKKNRVHEKLGDFKKKALGLRQKREKKNLEDVLHEKYPYVV